MYSYCCPFIWILHIDNIYIIKVDTTLLYLCMSVIGIKLNYKYINQIDG